MKHLRLWQAGLLIAIFAAWQVLSQPGLIPPFVWDNPHRAAFFFGEPLKMFKVIWVWFSEGEIYTILFVGSVRCV